MPTSERGWIRSAEEASIKRALDRLHPTKPDRAMNFDPGQEHLVCVSDLHRGKRDGADDFRRSERVYNAALAWYEARDYHLAVLGDAEDLWEGSAEQVLSTTDPASATGYARSLSVEARFQGGPGEPDRYIRLYGNHDGEWRNAEWRQALQRCFPKTVDVRAAITIEVVGEAADVGSAPAPWIMLTHGDAGTFDSAVFRAESKPLVRLWALAQKKIGALTGIPADDWDLREWQDRVLYDWARDPERPRLLLITGHTHRPVFALRRSPEMVPHDELARRGDELDSAGRSRSLSPEALGAGEYELAEARRQYGLRTAVRQEWPCYFNTGACCFGDGEITAIEIGDGAIRLVRWGAHRRGETELAVAAELLDGAPLNDVLRRIASPSPQPPDGPIDHAEPVVTVVRDPRLREYDEARQAA